MGFLAKAVVIILFVMSAWSIGVMIDRWIAFNAARKQSRAFAPAVAGALREGKIEEAIGSPSATRRATWRRSSPPACRNSVRTANRSEIPGEEDRSLQARSRTCRSHRARRIEARPRRSRDHRFDRAVRRTVRNRRRHLERVPGIASRRPPVSAPSPAVSRKLWSPPLSVCPSPSPPS